MNIEAFLRSNGPCLTSVASASLQATGLSAEAARQRVSRANGSVRRLDGLVFPKGARLLYLESQFNTHPYWEAILRNIGTASPAYDAAINALRARGGIVPEQQFHISCGSPILQKRQIASSSVLKRLLAIHLVERCVVDGLGPCIAFAANGHLPRITDQEVRARQVTERILLLAVKDWARRLGIASYDRIRTRDDDETPKVGTFLWDLTGPSYLQALVKYEADGRLKPGFLACDVIVGDSVDVPAAQAFLRKMTLLSGMRRIAPVFAMLVANRFDKEAFQLGRSRGIVMATPDTLFGTEVAEALKALLQTLTKASAVAASNPKAIVDLFTKLGKIEGAAANLRGALFESLVGHCVKKIDGGQIDIGKIIETGTERQAEVDVFRVREYLEVWSYECKGHQPSEVVGRDTVETWLTKKVPRIHDSLSKEKRFEQCRFHYEFWTCGQFSPEAKTLLEDAKQRIKKYDVGWKDGAEVRKYASRVKPRALADMLDQHFFQHPIATFERAHQANAELASYSLTASEIP